MTVRIVMRYLVLSDIHGGSEELKQALRFFQIFNCDFLILLGDLLNHGPRNKLPASYDPMNVGNLLNQFKEKIISIRGNCDSEVDGMVFDFPCNAAYGYLVVSTSKGIKKIFLTHGHLHKIETKEQISKLGLNEGDIVLSGHTHVSGIFFKESGVININPGSISIPKGGTQKGFALISENAIELYNLDGNLLNSYIF
jgi:hypothetical protein